MLSMCLYMYTACLRVSLCKNRAVVETWYDKTYHFESLSLLFAQKQKQKRHFLTFYSKHSEQIKCCKNQITVFWNSESILQEIVLSDLCAFDIHVPNYSHIVWFLHIQQLPLNYNTQKWQKHTEKRPLHWQHHISLTLQILEDHIYSLKLSRIGKNFWYKK